MAVSNPKDSKLDLFQVDLLEQEFDRQFLTLVINTSLRQTFFADIHSLESKQERVEVELRIENTWATPEDLAELTQRYELAGWPEVLAYPYFSLLKGCAIVLRLAA